MINRYDEATRSTYERAGFGHRVRRGGRPAIVVVDMMRGFTEDTYPSGSDLTEVIKSTQRLLEAGRLAGTPVLFTLLMYSPAEVQRRSNVWLDKAVGMRALVEGTPAVEIDPRLPTSPGDLMVQKKGASAFFGTGLAATLVSLGCDTVIVCGATTSGCVRATVVDGVQSGFPVLVPEECVGDRAPGPHEASLYDIQAKYGDVIGLDDTIDYLHDLADR